MLYKQKGVILFRASVSSSVTGYIRLKGFAANFAVHLVLLW